MSSPEKSLPNRDENGHSSPAATSGQCPLKPGRSDSPSPARTVKRWLLAGLGVGFVALGAIGAILPGIPTVGPLLLASFCFGKSCPWLERPLIRNRFFARFHHYLDGSAVMPMRARIATILLMWFSIGFSLLSVAATGNDGWIPAAVLGVAGLLGTWFIARYRRFPNSGCRSVAADADLKPVSHSLQCRQESLAPAPLQAMERQ
jgi:uncharacterized membrane protein YbaN (DUF454 family)